MLGVFLLLAFIHLGHERQEPVQWNACVHRLDLDLYSHPKAFVGNGVRSYVDFKEKSPLPEAQRRVEPVTLHHAGQRAQHTTH